MLDVWLVAAEPHPDWDGARRYLDSADGRELFLSARDANPLGWMTEVSWSDAQSGDTRLADSLDELDALQDVEDADDLRHLKQRWLDHLPRDVQEQLAAAMTELGRRAIDQLEALLPVEPDGRAPRAADVGLHPTSNGILYITAEAFEYPGDSKPVYGAFRAMYFALSTVFEAAGLFVPERIDVYRS